MSMSREKLLKTIQEVANTKQPTLSLFNSDLTELPREIALLTHLESLDLSDNNLRSLPDEIGLLTNLKHLNLDYNELDRSFNYCHC